MFKRIGDNIWLRHVAVAAGYAAAYYLLHQISISHWVLFAGLRLCVLLLVPYRYWAALLVGEMVPLAFNSLLCLEVYGWMWSAWMMVPPIGLAMPVVRWFRERRRLFPTKAGVSMNMLLLCTLLTSTIWAGTDLIAVALIKASSAKESLDFSAIAGRYFLGFYLGTLTVVPLVLLVREELLGAATWRKLLAKLPESRLVLETVSLLLPALAMLVWLASGAAGDASQEARVAMFLPVAWLAMRHGWRGAAVGGAAASSAVMLTMPSIYDSGTLQAQVFIAFTISTMLLLGARIATLHQRETQERTDARLALAMAQRNIYLGELQMRQTSYALEQMSGAIQSSYTQLLGRLRCLLPGTDERSYYRQAAVAQHQMYRLADTLYPLSWRERGLPAALREGSIPRALDEAGVVYWCDIDSDRLSQLSAAVHMTLYRLTSETIAYACGKRNVSKIRLRLRGGAFAGRRWAVLSIDSLVDYERLSRVRWDDLLPALGGSGMGLGAIKDRAGVFGGKVHVRSLEHGSRVSIMLYDPEIE